MKRNWMNKTGNNNKKRRALSSTPFESCLHATHSKSKRTAFGRSVIVAVVVVRNFIDVRSTHEFFVLFWFNIHKNLVHGRTTELDGKINCHHSHENEAELCAAMYSMIKNHIRLKKNQHENRVLFSCFYFISISLYILLNFSFFFILLFPARRFFSHFYRQF